MFSLFPKHKPRLAFNLCLLWAVLIAVLLINPGISPILLLLAGAIGSAGFFVAQYLKAAAQHNALLNRLYNQLDVDGFLRDYEPFLNVPLRNQNLYLMVRLHLSNAYCALGRFDDAIALLSAIQFRQDKPERLLLGKFTVASNLCYCYEEKGNIEAAQKQLDSLRDYKRQLEAIQQKKPEKQRMVYNIALPEQCMRFLQSGTLDIDVLQSQVQAANTQQLHRVTTSLWIARAYLAQHNRREAEKLLEQIVTIAPHIYPGKTAQQLLDEMPRRSIAAPDGQNPDDSQP